MYGVMGLILVSATTILGSYAISNRAISRLEKKKINKEKEDIDYREFISICR